MVGLILSRIEVVTLTWAPLYFNKFGRIWSQFENQLLGFFVTPEHPKRCQLGHLIETFIILGSFGAYLVRQEELDHQNCFISLIVHH